MQNIKNKIYEVMASVLECEVNEKTSLSMDNTESWTSLAQIDLIMSLEEELNITFKPESLPNLRSQEAIVLAVLELLK